MKLYFHKWRDNDTDHLFKTGEGRIANNIDQAIEDYYQEKFAYKYVGTLVLDNSNNSFIEINIEEEIEFRTFKEMTMGEKADHMGLTRQQVERIEARNY